MHLLILPGVPSSGEWVRWRTRMVAERDNQKVTKERTSALILLANARVWASEGWQVVITDADGKQLDPAGFEQWLAPVDASPLQPVNAASPEAEDVREEQDLSAQEQNLSAEASTPPNNPTKLMRLRVRRSL